MDTFQLGIFQSFPNPMISRYLAQLGWQWIIIDMQHGSFDFETVYECIHVIRAAGSRPFVRVSIEGFSEVNRVLDLGAAGVVVPMTNSREDAVRAAKAAKYPPEANGRLVVIPGITTVPNIPEKQTTIHCFLSRWNTSRLLIASKRCSPSTE
jgi:2-keto-3-deoxy-L-rhamnonate aldolase RhmA